jgi:hypothetical protein
MDAAGGTIRKDFERLDQGRRESLDKARFCAALTKPWVLPPEGWEDGQSHATTFSSLAARGVTNLEGRLLLALFPANQSFFKLRPAAKFRFDPEVDPELLTEFQQRLFIQELAVMAKIERDDHLVGTNEQRAGFRSRMRTALSQLLITGDVLIQVNDDYNLKIHRRDNYVTTRSLDGDVLMHITQETLDPLTLSDEQAMVADIDMETVARKSIDKRMMPIFNRVQWHPTRNRWIIEQELNGHTINVSEEKTTPFLSVPYELAPAAHYGRGLIEANLGDVRSMNELTERILDFAAIASKSLFCLDYNSQVRPRDLASPTGSVIQARVQGGQVTDVGVLKADKLQDFSVAQGVRESIRKDLASVMLMESEYQPRGERVTATQISRIASELDGALGGLYGPISDAIQIPLIERLIDMMRRSGELPGLPDDAVQIEAVTGIMALSNESDQQKLVLLMQTLAQFGPETIARFDQGTLLDLFMRQSGIHEPGLIKSEEQLAQEQQQAQEAALMQQAGQQAIQSGGKIAEQSVPNGE